MTKLKVSQEAFDEMVVENMETFSMEAEEAVSSAVEELKLQGADISGVIQSAPGTKRSEHPVAVAIEILKTPKLNVDEVVEPLRTLEESVKNAKDDKDRDMAVTVASKFDGMQTLVELMESLPGGKASKNLFATLESWLTMLEHRKNFFDVGGPEMVVKIMEKHMNDFEVMTSLAQIAASSSLRYEGNKCKFVDLEMHCKLHDLIVRQGVPDAAIVASCRAFCSFCSPDDPVPPATNAFNHARLLSSHDIGKTLMKIITIKFADGSGNQTWEEHKEMTSEILRAVKCLAANDEICKGLLEDGGVDTCLRIWKSFEGAGEAVGIVAGLLRQLSQSDSVKAAIMSNGGAEMIVRSLSLHVSDGAVLEPVLGLMTNLVLRQPNHSKAFCDAGCAAELANVLQTHEKNHRVLKQVCMCVRNMVSRAIDLRTLFLEIGFEEMFRSVKAKHPKTCADVSSAVLRDLGLENYL